MVYSIDITDITDKMFEVRTIKTATQISYRTRALRVDRFL
jgi:hypothetical protein